MLVVTSETADYYLASTDRDTTLAAVESSPNTLSVADYSTLWMTR